AQLVGRLEGEREFLPDNFVWQSLRADEFHGRGEGLGRCVLRGSDDGEEPVETGEKSLLRFGFVRGTGGDGKPAPGEGQSSQDEETGSTWVVHVGKCDGRGQGCKRVLGVGAEC